MDNILLDLALLTIGAHSLVVRAVLLTVPLNLDRSYVDVHSSCVVFIFDTTQFMLLRQALTSLLLRTLPTEKRGGDYRGPLLSVRASSTHHVGPHHEPRR